MIKKDKRNYRIHTEKNKELIKKSLKDNGFGRSILIDKNEEIIAGNGVFEQAQKLGLKTKIIETDGSKLFVIKRKDLKYGDKKRRELAIMDNSASDSSYFDFDLIKEDFSKEDLEKYGLGIEEIREKIEENEKKQGLGEGFSEEDKQFLPKELQGIDIEPNELEKIESDFETEFERVIIIFPFDRQCDLERLLGIHLEKIFYEFKDIKRKREQEG